MNRNKLFIYSLSSLAVMASSLASAEQLVRVPTFEGGITADIGTFYVQPSAEDNAYAASTIAIDGNSDNTITNVHNLNFDYEFGLEASLGYIFEDTANGIELSYRNLSTSDTSSASFPNSSSSQQKSIAPAVTFTDVTADGGFELNTFDLMISQYIDIGESMQMRFNGGLAYAEIEEQGTIDNFTTFPEPNTTTDMLTNSKSEFNGWGPRVGIDARYDFGDGIGIVGGGSLAYYLGKFDFNSTTVTQRVIGGVPSEPTSRQLKDNLDGQSVTNLRANLGVDYVYFFEDAEGATLGLELGYMVDYYADGIVVVAGGGSGNGSGIAANGAVTLPYDVTFSGPYLNLKGVF